MGSRRKLASSLRGWGFFALFFFPGTNKCQDASPQDASPQDASPQDASPQDAGPQDAGPHDLNHLKWTP
jgi:hypothetical protein